MSLNRDELVKEYLNNAHKVDGWLDQYSAICISDLSRFQSQNGINGSVGEIGVHLGRLLILLKLTAKPDEKCFALDVFGERHDCNTFLRNVHRWTGDTDMTVIQSSSRNIKPADIIDAVGQCRLVSIDGGHSEDLVYNDLQLIEAILTERGAVILDDFFNQTWPGVAAGATRFFLDPLTKIRPFAISPNKVYLAAPENHALYRDAFRRMQKTNFEQTDRMFGNDVDIFGCRRVSIKQRIQNRIRVSTIGSGARLAKKVFKMAR